mgnify:FL=1
MGVAHGIGIASRGFSAAFIFGDSLLDPGNDVYLSRNAKGADHAPYGRDMPDGRPGKFSNGLIASDVIGKLLSTTNFSDHVYGLVSLVINFASYIIYDDDDDDVVCSRLE